MSYDRPWGARGTVVKESASFVRRANISRLEKALWALVLVGLIGDVATTYVGLQLGLVESNPVALWLIQTFGVFGMLLLKVSTLAIGVVCRGFLPSKYTAMIPACIAPPWCLAALINLAHFPTVL